MVDKVGCSILRPSWQVMVLYSPNRLYKLTRIDTKPCWVPQHEIFHQFHQFMRTLLNSFWAHISVGVIRPKKLRFNSNNPDFGRSRWNALRIKTVPLL